MVINNNQYNWTIEHSRVINCDIERVWDVISMRSNLEAFHPFCKSNRVIKWPGKGAVDKIEYLNGLTLERNFINWIDKAGYDLYIFQAGSPASHVSWRIIKNDDKTNISIIISPYLFNQGHKLFNLLPFFLITKPLLSNYLKHVIGGLKLYAEKGARVKNNQFGKNLLFS
tara:strand:+ start:723 stop:1232 length:510 start_codon:yes stop_codon:yes gene_type:complete